MTDPDYLGQADTAPPDDWRNRAACLTVGGEIFFPSPDTAAADNRAAKRICRHCPVRAECLDFALANDVRDGIWGGLTERQRRAAKKGRTA